jgi:hypothetical protein
MLPEKRIDMTRARSVGTVILFGVALAAFAKVTVAWAAETNDLREFRVGMNAADLPQSGYAGFGCAADPGRTLSNWQDWRQCPPDLSCLRVVRFRYDPAMSPEGTKVAGHPVLLALVMDDAGRVEAVQIETDPNARLFTRKKAFLLGLRAKSRYGTDGWICTEDSPTADHQPVGETFVKEQCKKTLAGREVRIERSLFRHPNQDLKSFVSNTRILILWIP